MTAISSFSHFSPNLVSRPSVAHSAASTQAAIGVDVGKNTPSAPSTRVEPPANVSDVGANPSSVNDVGAAAASSNESSVDADRADDDRREKNDGSEVAQRSSKVDDQKRQQTDEQARNEARIKELEIEQIRELKQRDQEVRAHEQAHVSVGGQYAGSPSFVYETGPDGVKYTVSGEVPIDVSIVRGDPQATLAKMVQVQRAALAPAEPSSQDRQVAALAARLAAEARADILSEKRDVMAQSSEGSTASPSARSSSEGGSYEGGLRSLHSDAFSARANGQFLSIQNPSQSGQILSDIV